ncbi:type II toxin-antitoxin system PemK/MazF family toxin [Campylobacterota bacterium DY0563]
MNLDNKNTRIDIWNNKKKIINEKISINHKKDGSIKFRIQPLSLWWFELGKNIGTETSCHFTNKKLVTLRPYVIISTNNFNHATYNKKVIVMPITSKKDNSKVKHFHYELVSDNYQSFYNKKRNINYLGLEKDSLVICNDIKTIDTKRLVEQIYPVILDKDIDAVQDFLKKYLSVF